MEYEKIIIELLGRIQTLEEQVTVLMGKQLHKEEKEEEKMTTDDIRGYIQKQKEIAKMAGKSELVLRSGDVHNDLGLKQRHPQVCNAMRHCMNSGDVILYQPPKGNGTTLRIEYKL
ncbi:MAG: hypothetical protein IKU51_04960 [Clostridia bacterium]|nr:hypothetical protein [Clostridia bacterium]